MGRGAWDKTRRYMLTSTRRDPRIDMGAIGLTDDRPSVFSLTGRAIKRPFTKREPAPERERPVTIHPEPTNPKAKRFFDKRGLKPLEFSKHPGFKGIMGMRGDRNHWEQQARYWISRGTSLGLFPYAVDKAAAVGAVTDVLVPGIGYAISLPVNA